jgi:hypothetical protein
MSAILTRGHLTTKITDRCWKRSLAANPTPEKSSTHETAARGSGSVHLLGLLGDGLLFIMKTEMPQ